MPKLSKADKAAALTATQIRLQKETALARMRQLDLAEREKTLLRADAVKAVWAEHLAQIRETFLAIPDRMADPLAGKTAAQIRDLLGKEIQDALDVLADSDS